MPQAGAHSPTVLLVEDHQLYRDGVRNLLEESGITVVGEATMAAEAVPLAANLRPEVALLDVLLPDSTGIDLCRRLLSVSPYTCVVMLSASAREENVSAALAVGACGYLLKSCPPEEIVTAVRAAAAGGSPLSPAVVTPLLSRFRESRPPAETAGDGVPALSERELEVIALLAAGRDNAEIAESLFISQHTVKNHVSGILAKLKVENRIQAAVYAVRKGLV